MAKSLNKAQVIGRLGKDPERKEFANGGSVVSFSVATSESWKDRNSGELRERTEWHRISIYNEALGRLAMAYLKTGDQVFLEGRMETRRWQDQSGQDRYMTEIALRPYAGEMTFLGGGRARGADADRPESSTPRGAALPGPTRNETPGDLYSGSEGYDAGGGRTFDDDLPF